MPNAHNQAPKNRDPLSTSTQGEAGPDFRNVDTWVFDLDNTLYRSDTNLFAQIEARMTEFIAKKLDVHPGEAYALQHLYYRSYGSTMSGLIQCNGVDPEEFLDYVHDIDLSVLRPEPKLHPAIARLPGRRCVFTNGCRKHVRRVLTQIGLSDVIDDVWDIRTTKYVPKPQPEAFRCIVEAGGFDPRKAAMFDDTARNLIPAFALGMITVWLHSGSRTAIQAPELSPASHNHIRYEIDDLADFLQTIRL